MELGFAFEPASHGTAQMQPAALSSDWLGLRARLVAAHATRRALLGEFAVSPRIALRENLRLWHGLGSGMYLLQWICAGVVVWKVPSLQVRSAGPS